MPVRHQSKTVLDLIQARAATTPDREAFIFLDSGERESDRLTYAQLDLKARAVAARLQAEAPRNSRVILLYPAGLDFITAWLGCIYAGMVAVPAYVPLKARALQRLTSIVDDCKPALMLVNQVSAEKIARHSEHSFNALKIRTLMVSSDQTDLPTAWEDPSIGPETLAMLQYTSGSTGAPKGVKISHGNILGNVASIAAAGSLDETCTMVSWLPLFHDMGLFGKILLPIYLGSLSVLMDPAAFVQKPVRWLQAITKYRAFLSAAPDSAYSLCVRKISDAAKVDLDLESWRIAYNGSEPVRARTISEFSEAFATCGFRRESMRPVFGMAEATLFVAGQAEGSPPAIESFDAEALGNRKIRRETSGAVRSMVSCGSAWGGHRLRIVDPDSGVPCAADEIGEIWFSGPSVGLGYWGREDDPAPFFNAQLDDDEDVYLRTGDLGFLDEGNLFVTGRLKDLIIVAGRNHYPQDLEDTAEASHPALARNASAAFAVDGEAGELVVLACEIRREALRGLDFEEVGANIRRKLAEEHELDLHAVVFLKPLGLPRTSSGKVQRSHTQGSFLAGEQLEVVGEWRRPVQPEVRPPASSPVPRSRQDITGWLVQHVSTLSGMPAGEVSTDVPFDVFGLDSHAAVSLSGDLQNWLGHPMPPTLVYDFPTIALLAEHLAVTGEVIAVDVERSAGDDAIAIIGMGCRFPGARNPEAFWRLLSEGGDAVAASARIVSGLPRSGLLADVDKFDAGFFGINAREAEAMDPQQRLLLEVAWETLENAGVVPSSLAGSRTAVMIGISNTDYARLAQDLSEDTGPYAATGSALSIAANRLSYSLDLRGPSWAVDTACSSSLVALHQACRSLVAGECTAALAGGVNLILAPQLSEAFTTSGMLSPDGECRAFDASANGYVRGEGVGLVLLKREADARRDGDNILALVRGSAVNQDGRSNGLTAPNGPAQQAVIRDALKSAKVEPNQVSYVEAHGTGTPLGDPIELNALVAVLGEARSPEAVCHVGSVKTNLGHLESAAGIASLIKVVLMMKHREIAPVLHYRSLNPHIALASQPFRIPQHPTAWTVADGSRIAGISSFGFGGTNAHIILGDAHGTPVSQLRDDRPFRAVTLSARTPEALGELASSYAAHFQSHPELDLADVASTANLGRTHFSRRAAFVAATLDELRTQLLGFEANGEARGTREAIEFAFHFEAFDPVCREAARTLRALCPAFRDLMDPLCPDLAPAADGTVFEAFQSSLAQFWLGLGVQPSVVIAEAGASDGARRLATSLGIELRRAGHAGVPAPGREVIRIGARAAGWKPILDRLAALYTAGATIRWAALDPDRSLQRVALPTYPFQRQSYWLRPANQFHVLLGRPLARHADGHGSWAWEAQFDSAVTALFDGHRVMGSIVVPYAAYVEMALSAASEIDGQGHTAVTDLALHAPLRLDTQGSRVVQTVLNRRSDAEFSFAVYQRAGASTPARWQLCASATIQDRVLN